MRTGVQTKEVRDSILDATDRLLSQYGYKKMTIDDLAREVGIGKGSIYLHFKSKEEIALSHIDRIIQRLCRKLSEIENEDLSQRDKLLKMTLMRVTFRFDSVQHYTQSLDELLSSLRVKLLARRRKYHDAEANIYSRVIEDGQKSGAFVEGNPLEIAHTFLLATNSLLPFSLSTKELGKRRELVRKTEYLTELLLRGIKKA
jgi:AcrR family transcriptional regulator